MSADLSFSAPDGGVRVQAVRPPQSTGIPALDAQLRGGLRPGTLHLVVCDDGDEGELLAMHLAHGAPTLYLHTDRQEACIRQTWSEHGHHADDVTFAPIDAPLGGDHERIIVDTISGLAMDLGFDEALRRVRKAKDGAFQAGLTVILVVVAPMHTPAEMARFGLIADGVFRLHRDVMTQLCVDKMRGLAHKVPAMNVGRGQDGLKVDTVRRVL